MRSRLARGSLNRGVLRLATNSLIMKVLPHGNSVLEAAEVIEHTR